MQVPIGRAGGTADKPAVFFTGPDEFRAWLQANHDSATELWMGLQAKHVPDRGLTWAQAVPQALCFGWIDSVVQRIDEDSRRQRWTPRRAGSKWSAVNIAHVQRLLAQGQMHPAGIAAYERRPSGDAGYSYQEAASQLSPSQLDTLAQNPAAQAFWDAATPTYRRVVISWMASAKRQQTRAKRLAELVTCSAEGKLIVSQRYGKQPKWVERAAAAAVRAHPDAAPDLP